MQNLVITKLSIFKNDYLIYDTYKVRFYIIL